MKKEKSKLLLNEKPLILLPTLARIIGLNESIVVRQIHYWIIRNKKNKKKIAKKNGKIWCFRTYNQWQEQFPFWHINTIKATFKSLKKSGFIATANYNKFKYDKTQWYRLNDDIINNTANEGLREYSWWDEDPLIILPELACLIGLNEAIILQQIHYWVKENKKEQVIKMKKNGLFWCFRTYNQWQEQFPFWSVKTIQRTFRRLENKGIVLTSSKNIHRYDRTKWYRINYSEVKFLTSERDKIVLSERTHKGVHMQRDKIVLSQRDKIVPPIQETKRLILSKDNICASGEASDVSHETSSSSEKAHDMFGNNKEINKKASGKNKESFTQYISDKEKVIEEKINKNKFIKNTISFWNTIPNITCHNKPTKVWLDAARMIRALRSGKLYRKRFDKDFLKRNNIPEEILRYKFSRKEIIDTLQKVSLFCQDGYFLKNKGFSKSLPNVIYNPYSKIQSLFLIACVSDAKPITPEAKPKYPEITRLFCEKTGAELKETQIRQLNTNLVELNEYYDNHVYKGVPGNPTSQKKFGDFKSFCNTLIEFIMMDRNKWLNKEVKQSVHNFKSDSKLFGKMIEYYQAYYGKLTY